jgi:hypothetical protein
MSMPRVEVMAMAPGWRPHRAAGRPAAVPAWRRRFHVLVRASLGGPDLGPPGAWAAGLLTQEAGAFAARCLARGDDVQRFFQ